MFLAVDGTLAGFVAVADPVRATSRQAIATLHELGLKVIMATGDNRATADAVARRLGIDEVHAEVLPEDKARIVADLKRAGKRVAMAGDGINDAPALASADVGIAMGAGADVAIESAGITLMAGDLNGIVRARRLAAATMGNIRQNLFFAFVYNALGVPLAAGVLYPVFGLLLSPIIAAAAMSFSSVSVIANALAAAERAALKPALLVVVAQSVGAIYNAVELRSTDARREARSSPVMTGEGPAKPVEGANPRRRNGDDPIQLPAEPVRLPAHDRHRRSGNCGPRWCGGRPAGTVERHHRGPYRALERSATRASCVGSPICGSPAAGR